MEEIREAAMAYYQNLPEALREGAHLFFKEKDLDGDGKMSKKEFLTLFEKLVADEVAEVVAEADGYEKLFTELDQYGNGTLEFSEFLSFYYLHPSGRLLLCHGCQAFLKGLYFTCPHCFNQEGESTTTHNVCSSCYRDGCHLDHSHQNVVTFVDNYALLLSKIGCNNTSTSKKWRFRKHKGSKSEPHPNRFATTSVELDPSIFDIKERQSSWVMSQLHNRVPSSTRKVMVKRAKQDQTYSETVEPAAHLKCPNHKKITTIEFASFGDPVGTYGTYFLGNATLLHPSKLLSNTA